MARESKDWWPGPERLPPFVGRCVRFMTDVERELFFTVKAGMTGVINFYDEELISVHVHQDLGEGAEDNDVTWWEESLDEFLEDVQVLERCPGEEE